MGSEGRGVGVLSEGTAWIHTFVSTIPGWLLIVHVKGVVVVVTGKGVVVVMVEGDMAEGIKGIACV